MVSRHRFWRRLSNSRIGLGVTIFILGLVTAIMTVRSFSLSDKELGLLNDYQEQSTQIQESNASSGAITFLRDEGSLLQSDVQFISYFNIPEKVDFETFEEKAYSIFLQEKTILGLSTVTDTNPTNVTNTVFYWKVMGSEDTNRVNQQINNSLVGLSQIVVSSTQRQAHDREQEQSIDAQVTNLFEWTIGLTVLNIILAFLLVLSDVNDRNRSDKEERTQTHPTHE